MKIDNKELLQVAGCAVLGISIDEGIDHLISQMSDNDAGLFNLVCHMNSKHYDLMTKIIDVHTNANLSYRVKMPITDKMTILDNIISVCEIFDVDVKIRKSTEEYGNHELVFSKKAARSISNAVIASSGTYSVFGDEIDGKYVNILVRDCYIGDYTRVPDISTMNHCKELNSLVSLLFKQWLNKHPNSTNMVVGDSMEDCFNKLNINLGLLSYISGSNGHIMFKRDFYFEISEYEEFMMSFKTIMDLANNMSRCNDDVVSSLTKHIDKVGYENFVKGNIIDTLTNHMKFILDNANDEG